MIERIFGDVFDCIGMEDEREALNFVKQKCLGGRMSSRASIIAIRLEQPNATEARIATLVGISKSRVSQILIEEGLPTRHASPVNIKWLGICPECGVVFKKHCLRQVHCNKLCFHNSRLITIYCSDCGKPIEKLRSEVERKRERGQRLFFCNRICLGKYLGKIAGFGAQPENRFNNTRRSYASKSRG